MKHCKKCLMPDTRPGALFNEEGICQACINYENRSKIDWNLRKQELDEICEKYRRSDGYYDCIIPVSGGKDSHRLVYEMKVLRQMNPLLITVGDPFTKTIAGGKNYRNLGETFGCDHILFEISIDLFKRVTRIAFEEFGEPLRFIEWVIYTIPLKMAIQFNIPLVIFGENSAYEYGTSSKEQNYANETIDRIFKATNVEFWGKKGVSLKELNSIIPPTAEEYTKVDPKVLFLSYFIPWSSVANLQIAKKYGFHDLAHEWIREGYIENFEQMDSIAYLIHLWLKYPKFGFQRTSDIASRRVREGLLSLSEATRLIQDNDPLIDQRALDDFCAIIGYSTVQFWEIVEKFWNRNLFEKKDGIWIPKFQIADK